MLSRSSRFHKRCTASIPLTRSSILKMELKRERVPLNACIYVPVPLGSASLGRIGRINMVGPCAFDYMSSKCVVYLHVHRMIIQSAVSYGLSHAHHACSMQTFNFVLVSDVMHICSKQDLAVMINGRIPYIMHCNRLMSDHYILDVWQVYCITHIHAQQIYTCREVNW
jgi:hypothetical protein